MIAATYAVRGVPPQAFTSAKRHAAVSGPIRKAILVLLAECANYACTIGKTRPTTKGRVASCAHRGRCEWICAPGAAMLVEETGWGLSTIERAVRQLAEDGWILAERHGKGRLYRINRAKLHAERSRETTQRDTAPVQRTGVSAEATQSKALKVPTPVRRTALPVSTADIVATAPADSQAAPNPATTLRGVLEAVVAHSEQVLVTVDTGESAPEGADVKLGRQVWEGMSKALKAQIGSSSFDRWILPIAQLGVKDGTLYLQVPSEDWDQVPSRYDFESYLPEGIRAINVLIGTKGDA